MGMDHKSLCVPISELECDVTHVHVEGSSQVLILLYIYFGRNIASHMLIVVLVGGDGDQCVYSPSDNRKGDSYSSARSSADPASLIMDKIQGSVVEQVTCLLLSNCCLRAIYQLTSEITSFDLQEGDHFGSGRRIDGHYQVA
jgi:hypothetical protein